MWGGEGVGFGGKVCLGSNAGMGKRLVTELSTMPVGIGGDADEVRLVESDGQGDGVSEVNGGDMYADEA